MSKLFADLDEREILALAISLEEEDSRIYFDFTERLKASYPETSAIFQRYRNQISLVLVDLSGNKHRNIRV
jgi:rubrerythrin